MSFRYPKDFDVIVVGAGVVGVTTAYELGKLGYRVRVLESSSSICGAAAASYGNAGTLGVSAKTQPLCKSVLKLIRDTLKGFGHEKRRARLPTGSVQECLG